MCPSHSVGDIKYFKNISIIFECLFSYVKLSVLSQVRYNITLGNDCNPGSCRGAVISWVWKYSEPRRDKTNKMAFAPSEDSDQPGHPPSLIRVFAVHMKKALVLTYPLSAQRRLGWSESSLGRTIILLVLSWGGSCINARNLLFLFVLWVGWDLSHVMRNPVFVSWRPGKTQTSLLSYWS